MDNSKLLRLRQLLLHARVCSLSSGTLESDQELRRTFNSICKQLFDEQVYRDLWDEPILNEIMWLFGVITPEPSKFGRQVAEISERAQQVRLVNDFFFQVLYLESSAEQVSQAMASVGVTNALVLDPSKVSDRLAAIRQSEVPPSKKIAVFLDFLKDSLDLTIGSLEPIRQCLQALTEREGIGKVNALLVKATGDDALVIPLMIKVQPGSGQIYHAVAGREDFKAAVERARLAMLEKGFLRYSHDIVYTLDLTEAQYTGPSISLPAAVAMYGSARGIVIDPFTTFTGDIKLHREGNWRVEAITGLLPKLEAASLAGCRRIFIPRANMDDLSGSTGIHLQIIPVDDLLNIFLKLHAPLQPLAGDSLQVRKINELQGFCQREGWHLSQPQPIQDGVQFRVASLNLPELVVSIYNKGPHAPQKHDRQQYQQLLDSLRSQEASRIPIRKIEEKFNLQDASLRAEIREILEHLHPVDQRKEAHCEYMSRFERGHEHVVVKQYEKGTLQVQGTAGELYKDILEPIVLRYNLRYPNAQLSVEALLKLRETVKATASSQPLHSGSVQEVPLPHIGTDESGKGDYFGAMVIAGVWVDMPTIQRLKKLGVKDSKLLSDNQSRELAAQIREICRGKYEEVEIPPERYNELYESFRKEGKNLNFLLAWGHARAIESLLERLSCTHAVADQFGDEHYILSKLMEKGKKLKLVQLPKGERYIAVAAASILARDRFLARLEKLGQEYGIQLPKGSADIVVRVAKQIVERRGPEELRKVGKLHHKTTQKILGQE